MNSKCTNPPENWLDHRFEHVELKIEIKKWGSPSYF